MADVIEKAPLVLLLLPVVLLAQDQATTTISTTTKTAETLVTPTPHSLQPDRREPKFNASEFRYGHYCTCDLTSGVCDANCCCDKDCREDDVRAFSGCHTVRPFNPDPRYCYTHDIVAKNNTQYLVERGKSSAGENLLCIMVDNLVDHARYLERPAVTNVTIFNDLVQTHQPYSWSPDHISKPKKKKTDKPQLDPTHPFSVSHYQVGFPIWTWDSQAEELGVLSLPSAMNAQFCNTFEPVRYMEDLEAPVTCHRSLYVDEPCSQLSYLDANHYLKNELLLVKSPYLFRNRSLPQNSNEQMSAFTKVQYQVCMPQVILNEVDGRYETTGCVNVTVGSNFQIPSPTTDCKNVLRRLSYEIRHEGIKGITRAYVNIELDNLLSAKTGDSFYRKMDDMLLIRQEFTYTHLWESDNSSSQAVSHSGNPGYLMGRPVLSGMLTHRDKSSPTAATKSDQNEIQMDKWTITSDPLQQSMTVLSAVPQGDCSNATSFQRRKVLFGHDSVSGCSFKVKRSDLAKDCSTLKDNILHLLTGSPTHRGVNSLDRMRVATFGNSDPNKPGDWVKVMVVGGPTDHLEGSDGNQTSSASAGSDKKTTGKTCKGMILSLHIEVTHASVGSLANPQSKIVGVQYRFGRQTDVSFRCVGLGACKSVHKVHNIDVTTSVSFVDVTRPALDYYAEYPVLKVRLPYDFFYPFVTKSPIAVSSATQTQWIGYSRELSYGCFFFCMMLLLKN